MSRVQRSEKTDLSREYHSFADSRVTRVPMYVYKVFFFAKEKNKTTNGKLTDTCTEVDLQAIS